MVSERTRDRGQLLLVGGIAIAVVVLGTMVVLNGLEFTDTLGAQSNDEAIRDAQRTQSMVVDHVGGIARQVREETAPTGFGENVSDNISTFDRTYSAFTYSSSDVHVNVSFNETASAGTGALLRQPSRRGFADPAGNPNWDVARDVTTVDEFNLSIDELPDPGPTGEFTVIVSNATRTWVLRVDGTGGVAVKEGGSGTYTTIDTVSGSDLPLWVDVAEGCYGTDSDTRDCPSDLTFARGVSPPYDIRVENFPAVALPSTNPAEGTYAIATDSDYVPPGTGSCPGPNPCQVPVVGNVKLDISIVQPDFQQETSVWVNETEDTS